MRDLYYKRIFTEILLRRERGVPYKSSRKEQTQLPKLRPTKSRFADIEDPMPLVMSFGIGAALLTVVHFIFPSSQIDYSED